MTFATTPGASPAAPPLRPVHMPRSAAERFGLMPHSRIRTPGDTRDLLCAQLSAITEARGRLSECRDLADVRVLLQSMADERKPEVAVLERLERERLEEQS